MRKLKSLVVVMALAFAFTSCSNHPDQPTSQAELEAGQITKANEESLSSKTVQGEWELIEVNGEGVNFELYKGTVLKFQDDAMYKTQNTNKDMGIFFIKDGVLHWTISGLNEVTFKVVIVDGNLHLTNGINQTFIYKKL